MKIVFIRHGQTNDNFNKIFSGQKDVPLNKHGIMQAKKIAKQLSNLQFDFCFCSPLLRAKQTMEEIVKFHKGLKIEFDARLMERDYGNFVNKSEHLIPPEVRWDMNFVIGNNVETIEGMIKRVKSFLHDSKNLKQKNILIVAHSGIGRVFRALIEGMPENKNLKDLGILNAEAHFFNFN